MIEKRLYIVVPKLLEIPGQNRGIIMTCGRLMAQAVHVGSKLKMKENLDPDLATTTVVLSVPNSLDLPTVLDKVKKANLPWATFMDDNFEVYGTPDSLLTAVACLCSKKKGKSLFYGIDSWKCESI